MPFDGTHLTKVQQLLIKARALAEEGWCQNTLHVVKNGKNHYCIAGAIFTASEVERLHPGEHYYTLYNKALNVMLSVIRVKRGPISIENYNDAKSRRKAHALAAFDRAIIKAGK